MIWNKNYETGNTEVDNEHKEIFSLVQKVIDATFNSCEEKIETVVDFLATYTIKHFEHEEHLMNESNYPDIDIHKKQHSDFVGEVAKLKEEIAQATGSLSFSLTVNKVIVNWLTSHILDSDMKMAAYYRDWAK